jgi:hypothetical protein
MQLGLYRGCTNLALHRRVQVSKFGTIKLLPCVTLLGHSGGDIVIVIIVIISNGEVAS